MTSNNTKKNFAAPRGSKPQIQHQQMFTDRYPKRCFFSPRNIEFVLLDKDVWALAKTLVHDAEIVVDLAAGSGALMSNIAEETKAQLFAVDFSAPALMYAREAVPKMFVIQCDILHTPFPDNFCDFCTCTMAIEHVDDHLLLDELSRILRPGGHLLISTVLKAPGSWYFYKNEKGETVTDPTHLREYRSLDDFQRLLRGKTFEPVLARTPRLRFPLIDPLYKIIFRYGNRRWQRLPASGPFEFLRLITRLPLPGYHAIEIVARKDSQVKS